MDFGEIINRIARKHGTTPEHVYGQIQSAIEEALLRASADAAKEWGKFPTQASRPTPEELVKFLVDRLTCS